MPIRPSVRDRRLQGNGRSAQAQRARTRGTSRQPWVSSTMNTTRRSFAAAVVCAMLAMPSQAQVPDGHLVVSSFSASGAPGVGGIYTIDPNASSPAWTPVTGLPAALATAANCVLRDPATEHLIAGNLSSASGGSADAFVLSLNGHVGTVLYSIHLGSVGGVHGAALLPGGGVLLALGGMGPGPAAGRQLVRWTPASGALTPIVLPAAYVAGDFANAVVCDGGDALVGLYNGFSLSWEVIQVPLAGGASTTIWTGLGGEFPTQLAIDCHGWLQVATSRQPYSTTTGRIVTFAKVAGAWVQTGALSGGGRHFNALAVDPGTCRMFTSAQGPGTFGLDEIAGGALLPLSAGPGGVISGIDSNPNPEVLEQPSGASPASWSFRPFPGGLPTAGGSFTMSLGASGTGIAVAFLDLASTPSTVLGLSVYLTPAGVPLSVQALPNPQWTWSIPAQPSAVGTTGFVQSIVLEVAGLGASDLLQFTIR